MAPASEISVGVSHELAITACKAGFLPADFATLAHGEEKLVGVLGVLRGTHEIRAIKHMIDLSLPGALPFEGAEVEVHRSGGVVKLEKREDGVYLGGRKLTLFRSVEQTGDKVVGGHELRKEVEKRGNNVPSIVLDHFKKYPALWPEEWKVDEQGHTVYVYFWDDIFRNPADGVLYVRYGYWRDGRVKSDYRWLGDGWRARSPAASRAS